MNRQTAIIDANGYRREMSYDAVGNLKTKTDYQNDVTTYQHDSTNRLVVMRNPAYLQVSYHYDGAGRLLNREKGGEGIKI